MDARERVGIKARRCSRVTYLLFHFYRRLATLSSGRFGFRSVCAMQRREICFVWMGFYCLIENSSERDAEIEESSAQACV